MCVLACVGECVRSVLRLPVLAIFEQRLDASFQHVDLPKDRGFRGNFRLVPLQVDMNDLKYIFAKRNLSVFSPLPRTVS